MTKTIKRNGYEFVITLDVGGDAIKVWGYPEGQPEATLFPGVYQNQYRDYHMVRNENGDRCVRILYGSIAERVETLICEALREFDEYKHKTRDVRIKEDAIAEFEKIK